jgi:chromosome segregation ATPase
LNVYNAKQDLAARETELEKVTASIKAAQTEIEEDTAAIAATKKLASEAPSRLPELKKGCVALQDAIAPANAAAESAKSDLAQKQALLTQANELSTKLWAESKKSPNDKELAEAAGKAKATVDALTTGVAAATKEATAKDEAAKAAVAASTAAETSRQKYKQDVEGAANKVESLQKSIAVAQSEIPKRKAAAEEAAKVVEKAKTKVAQLTAEYQKKSQEAGLNAQASAQSKG